jgi:hypothetical protein
LQSKVPPLAATEPLLVRGLLILMNMQEIWKDIPKYFGKFQVSNMGRVRHRDKGILKQHFQTRGYKIVSLRFGKQTRTKTVHRLVAEAFIDNPENKAQTNHINGKKTDNRVVNLEWCTAHENMRHASKMGLLNRKSYNKNVSVLSVNEVLQVRSIYDQGWFTVKEISHAYNVTPPAIYKIINRQSYAYL